MASVSIKHRAEYFALLAAAAVIRPLPRKRAIILGRALGRLALKVLPGRYRMATENMRLALPELSTAEIEKNVRMNFEHIGICGVDMLRFDMLQLGHKDAEKYIVYDGLQLLQDALALGRGVLLLSAHLGFWEVGGFALADKGIQFDMVAKPLKNPLADQYFAKLRKSYGAEILNSRKGARRILQSLQANHVVGIMLDQNISPPGSVPTEFFGRKAYTTTAIASMAMKYQIPIVPVFCLRQPDDRYKVWAEPMVILDDDRYSIAENTQRLTDIIETAVRKDVTQWFWLHKRWRVKPKAEGLKSE